MRILLALMFSAVTCTAQYSPRVNLGSPGAIGGTTPGTGAFTSLTVAPGYVTLNPSADPYYLLYMDSQRYIRTPAATMLNLNEAIEVLDGSTRILGVLGFSSASTVAPDVGFARTASGVLKATNGSSGAGTLILKPPTSCSGLAAGTLWNNAGTIGVCP